jgi:hypothetical protein
MKSIDGQIGTDFPVREVLLSSTSVNVSIGDLLREFQVFAAAERAGPAFWGTE